LFGTYSLRVAQEEDTQYMGSVSHEMCGRPR
jgi:hypothetical protein